jgi:hypothetical protein
VEQLASSDKDPWGIFSAFIAIAINNNPMRSILFSSFHERDDWKACINVPLDVPKLHSTSNRSANPTKFEGLEKFFDGCAHLRIRVYAAIKG